jgi:glycosyltransferase involved in cell wall biosynthesis
MFIMGIPYVAIRTIQGDSGFIEIAEPLAYMGEKYGAKSVLYLDHDFKDTDLHLPEYVQAIFADHSIQPRHNSYRVCPGLEVTAKYLPGQCSTPVDFIFTNRKTAVHNLVTAGYDFRLRRNAVPVVLDVLTAGAVGATRITGDPQMQHEAMAYAMVDRIIFSTPLEMEVGISICKKFLAPSQVMAVKRKSLILGDGISDYLADYRKSPEEVAERLTTKRDHVKVAFAGRLNSNKGVDKVFKTMRRLFARHSMQLTLITQTQTLDKKHGWQDVQFFLEERLCGVEKEKFVSTVLPSCDMFLNASILEGYTVLVAEACYIGVPVILPNKKWAAALVGEHYPFMYDSLEQMYAMVGIIRDGLVPVEWIERFEKTRRKLAAELSSVTADGVYQAVSADVNEIDEYIRAKEPHSRVLETVLEKFPIGSIKTIAELGKFYPNQRIRSRQGFDGFFLYKYLKPFIEPVDAKLGSIRRVR